MLDVSLYWLLEAGAMVGAVAGVILLGAQQYLVHRAKQEALPAKGQPRPRVAVVVLGDLGHSPRMQYHVMSLTQSAGFAVDFVGYNNSPTKQEVRENPHVREHYIVPMNIKGPRALYLLLLPVKAGYLFLQLFWKLMTIAPPSYILVQNPPSIPSLIIVQLVRRLRRCRLVIDWHNFGYSILDLSMSRRMKWVVGLARRYERYFGQGAHANFCVTDAMRLWLLENWGIRGISLHDKPPTVFQTTPVEARHELFARLADKFEPITNKITSGRGLPPNQTLFTMIDSNGVVRLRPTRPSLVISATSFTPDEDFSILLEAVRRCEIKLSRQPGPVAPMVIVVTGKGPDKERFLEQVAKMPCRFIHITSMWLSNEDYPLLMGSCDLGISLHASSSGLDLPMKVVDMFGCGLPVLALKFSCLNELVVHDRTGLHFANAFDLDQQLLDLFKEFPTPNPRLEAMRGHVDVWRRHRWDDEWNQQARPVFT